MVALFSSSIISEPHLAPFKTQWKSLIRVRVVPRRLGLLFSQHTARSPPPPTNVSLLPEHVAGNLA